MEIVKIAKLCSSMELREGAQGEAIYQLERELNIKLPDEYKDFMQYSNGGVGTIGDNYLEIWPIEEINSSNQELLVEEFAPGLLLFGGDGANELFAFDTREANLPVVNVPMIVMCHDDAQFCNETFLGFLNDLSVSK